ETEEHGLPRREIERAEARKEGQRVDEEGIEESGNDVRAVKGGQMETLLLPQAVQELEGEKGRDDGEEQREERRRAAGQALGLLVQPAPYLDGGRGGLKGSSRRRSGPPAIAQQEGNLMFAKARPRARNHSRVPPGAAEGRQR